MKTSLPLRIPALLVLLLCGCDPAGDRAAPPKAPLLSEALPLCNADERAAFVAQKALVRAEYAERRMAFSPEQGPSALRQYALAHACFGAAGLEAEAADVEHRKSAFSARLNASYRMQRLRLQQALRQGRVEPAKSEARMLLRLLQTQPDQPYVRWLRRIERTGH